MTLPRIFLGLALLAAAARAEDFLKPAPEKTFAEMKIYDAAGRPWRVAQEDWAGARQRVKAEPRWRDWLEQERKTLDAWMKKFPLDRVTWVSGWFHDFVSPKDGSHVTWTEAIPGEEVSFLHSPSDPQIALTPKLVGGWVYDFRDRHAGMIARAARLYKLTGEERYAEWAARQLDYYAEHYREWPPQRQGARLFSQSLDVAVTMFNHCEAVRLLGDYVAPARRETWRSQLFQPEVEETLNKNLLTIHNIATWHRCAAAEYALVFGDEAMWRFALDSKFGLRAQVAQGITDDYLWWEQSFHYNDYVVEALRGLFVSAGLQGRADALSAEMVRAENLMLSPAYLRFPNGVLPNPADGTGHEVAPDVKLFESVYRIFPTASGLQAAQARRDWETLLDPPPAAPPVPALPVVRSASFEATRMAQLVAGRWQVYLHYGQLTASHAQSEALNFSASYAGTDITHDPGTVGYGSPLHKEYYTRGLNHNVPLVAGEAEEAPPEKGTLLGFSETKASAAQPAYRKKAAASRTLEIVGDTLVDTATIESTGPGPQPLGLALHLQGRVQLPKNFVVDDRFASGRPAAFGYWRDVRSAEYRDRAEFTVQCGDVTLRVTLATPGAFKIWHGSTPDEPPRRREGFYLETSGTKAVFTTTFEPVK